MIALAYYWVLGLELKAFYKSVLFMSTLIRIRFQEITLKRVEDVPNCGFYLWIERETNNVEWFGLGGPLAFADAVLPPDVRSCEGGFEVDAL